VFGVFKRTYDWMGSSINSVYADYILCFLFYLEAIFFLPTDPILIVYCLERRDRALWYATIATLGSVLGGMTSYALGAVLWNYVGEQIIHNYYVNCILSPDMFHNLSAQYRQHEWLAILIAGFTPIPYKAATLAAGFCKISFGPFVIASMIARGARFFLFAIVCKIYGEKIKDSINKYFNLLLLFAAVLIILSIWLFT
jgi:membrane protein YqaA with SNARE-associated domain